LSASQKSVMEHSEAYCVYTFKAGCSAFKAGCNEKVIFHKS